MTSSSEDKDKSLAAEKSNEDLALVMQPGSRLAVGIHVQHKNGQEGSSTSHFDQYADARATLEGGLLDSPSFARHEMAPVLAKSGDKMIQDPND